MPFGLVPVHTRVLSLQLEREGVDSLAAEARIMDLRKRGVVRVAGGLGGPGLIHDMGVRLRIGLPDLVVRSADLVMPAVPFPGAPATSGESCRDNEARFASVVGLRFGRGLVLGLQRSLGGPRGCFHVFTLLRLLGGSIPWALQQGSRGEWGRFARTVSVDGLWDGTHLALRGSLVDVHHDPVSADLAGAAFEAEAEAAVTVPGFDVVAVAARHRRVGASGRAWTAAGLEGTQRLCGQSMARGYSMVLDDVIPPGSPQAPVRELLAMLQPVAFQCVPGIVADGGAPRPARRPDPMSAVGSCAMWRHDGPLAASVRER
jgi:hypothetical protein